jgi:hypothetical protein
LLFSRPILTDLRLTATDNDADSHTRSHITLSLVSHITLSSLEEYLCSQARRKAPTFRSNMPTRERPPQTPDDGSYCHYYSTADPRLKCVGAPDPILLKLTLKHIFLPRYIGMVWWFPEKQPEEPQLETLVYWIFTIVNSMQTFSYVILPCLIWFRVGLLYTALSLPLVVPLGDHLGGRYGSTRGSGPLLYGCLNVLWLNVEAFVRILSIRRESEKEEWIDNKIAVGIFFVGSLCVVGNLFSMTEHTMGYGRFVVVLV